MKALVLSGGAGHGAFQAGVIQGLAEKGWYPDIVCGTSVGSINAVALASGMSSEDLCALWLSTKNRDVWRFGNPKALFSLSPLRCLLERHVDFSNLQNSPLTCACFSVKVRSGKVQGYINKAPPAKFEQVYGSSPAIDVDAVLASCAIPIIFPWVREEWDGGMLLYAPLKPAVLLGADEIIVVEAQKTDRGLPQGPVATLLRVVDIVTSSLIHGDMAQLKARNVMEGYRYIKAASIAPFKDFSYSKLNFSSYKGKETAINHGRLCAFLYPIED